MFVIGWPYAMIGSGNLDGDVVLPEDVDFDPANVTPASAVRVPQPHNTPPPGAEAHLQALDHAFGRAPLPILGSLSGRNPTSETVSHSVRVCTASKH